MMYNNNNDFTYTANYYPQQPQPQPQTQEKMTHPEWGVMKDKDFHSLTLKHQKDLERLHQENQPLSDFYFWQANLGGYCMANMLQSVVISSEGHFPLVRRIVDGAPHPGRRKKKQD